MALRTLWSRIDWPRKRESAGAFCDTTATSSCMTLSAIDLGICIGCDVAEAAPGDGRHQLARLLVPEHDGDPVHAHDLEGHVDHRAKQPVQVELGGELLGDLEQHLELEGLAGLARRRLHLELAHAVDGPGW